MGVQPRRVRRALPLLGAGHRRRTGIPAPISVGYVNPAFNAAIVDFVHKEMSKPTALSPPPVGAPRAPGPFSPGLPPIAGALRASDAGLQPRPLTQALHRASVGSRPGTQANTGVASPPPSLPMGGAPATLLMLTPPTPSDAHEYITANPGGVVVHGASYLAAGRLPLLDNRVTAQQKGQPLQPLQLAGPRTGVLVKPRFPAELQCKEFVTGGSCPRGEACPLRHADKCIANNRTGCPDLSCPYAHVARCRDRHCPGAAACVYDHVEPGP